MASSRLTRAKAAALESKNGNVIGTATTGLQSKQVGVQNSRKRAALGDVSNVHNKEQNALIEKGGKPATKLIKVASSSNILRSRSVVPTSKAAIEKEGTDISARAQDNSTDVSVSVISATARRKQRVPLRSVSVARTASRDADSSNASASSEQVRATRSTKGAQRHREESMEETEEDKENADPTAERPRVRAASHNGLRLPQQKMSEDHRASLLEMDAEEVEQASLNGEVERQIAACQEWDDLDAEEMDDPSMVAEYVDEIFEYMHRLEWNTMPNPKYMDDQKDLKWSMREILVDWLVEVHAKFRLLPETLFLAINVVDRFLSLRVVTLDKLQLVGITSMFIAAKYEEVFSPSIQNFVYVADSGYSEDEILRAERFILQVLDFNLSYPNPMNFLRRNSKADNYDIQTRTVAKYLMEIALLDHRFLKYCPSHVAATAMYLSRVILERSSWNRNLVHYSGGYTEERIMPVCNLMIDYLVKPVVHDAFFKKYASKRFLKASILARQWAKKRVEASPLAPILDDEDEDDHSNDAKSTDENDD